MTLTKEHRALVMTEVQKQPYSSRFDHYEIRRALDSAVSVFDGFEQIFLPGFCEVLLHPQGTQRHADFARELIPSLAYAHRHFGTHIPKELTQKLRNDSQTHDTLLELICLGVMGSLHTTVYEPSLPDGKTPDLMVKLCRGGVVYIECKSQSMFRNEHHRLFKKATERIHNVLDLKTSEFIKNAWCKGLRTEVHLSDNPSERDIRELEDTLSTIEPRRGRAIARFGSISLDLVPKEKPYDESKPPPSAEILVGTTPTAIHQCNVHSVVYPWSGLDIIRRRSQHRLLATARKKLWSMPDGSQGVICIQTYSSKKFAPDIHRLLSQPSFSRIPIVWQNPIGSGQVIARNDALSLRDELFGDLLTGSKTNANDAMDSDDE